MIAIIALAVLFIFFCVLAFMSGKNWLLRHVFLLLGVFIMSMVFMVFAAMTLKTHEAWKSRHAQLTADLERTEKKIEEISSPVAIPEEGQSLPQLQAELSRLLMARGRVWRAVRVASAEADAIELDMSAWNNSPCVRASVDDSPQPVAGDEGAAAAIAEDPQISERMLVHAFVEGNVTRLSEEERQVLFGDVEVAAETRGPCTVPARYLGHFLVTAVGENGITLRSIHPLDDQQLAIVDEGGDWTLYEVLPVDDHATLLGLSKASLESLMTVPGDDIQPDKLAASVREFHRDLSPADSDDPPERVWAKVNFLVDDSIQVDIEAEEVTEIDRSFDVRGRAIAANLRHGGPVEFKVGDTAEFDSATANQLVEQGKCELVNEPSIYVRALRNYERIFRQDYDELTDVQDAIQQTASDTATIVASAEEVRRQIAYREKEKGNLGEDLDGFRNDDEVITSYRDELHSQRQLQLQELSRFYESNLQLRSQMSGF
jgi:hypothetical protein